MRSLFRIPQAHCLLYIWRVLLLALAGLPAVALAQEQPAFAPNVVVVQFEPDIAIAEGAAKAGFQAFDRIAATFGVHTIERVFPFLDHVQPTPKTAQNLAALRRTYYVRYSADENPEGVAKRLALAPEVTYAEPVLVNRLYAPDRKVEPNDSLYSDQTYLRHLRLPEAWDVVKGEDKNPPVVIAIVDGGGDWRHEDLQANVWTNADEIPGNGVDDDNNGFVDDVHGVNFANEDDTDNDPTGLLQTPGNAWHGTAVAGVAGAVTDNSTGLAGAAWNVELMHINAACTNEELICYGFEGVLYAAANGADIINTSWGGYLFGDAQEDLKMIAQVLDLATVIGALVVASAGNENSDNDLYHIYPSNHPRVLAVGATARDSRSRAEFSNYGQSVNVFAPGVEIITSAPDGAYTRSAIGTSFAAPLVSGIAALVKTRYPGISADALREQVRLSSENMDAENPGYAGRLGRGYVNAEAALQAPAFPAVRLRRWSQSDTDGDGLITSGEEVTITATVVNHLADARQLAIGLAPAASYPFLDMTLAEQTVGALASGDSAVVTLRFTVAPDAPINQRVRFFLRIRDGTFVDHADQISFGVNVTYVPVLEGLLALYVSTDGDNWTDNTGWDITMVPTPSQLAQWYGVLVSDDWLVGLSLAENNLTGTLPAELGDISSLLELGLSFNSLSGAIPAELGDLSQLQRLHLGANSLSGAIPAELGNLSQLQVLELFNNSLSGVIPAKLGDLSQLQRLHLGANFLSGAIPVELGNLSQLQMLDLGPNSLSGAVPAELGNLLQLQWLDLFGNSLFGEIPSELGNLSQLQVLKLHNNSFSGTIPSELGNLSELQRLYLSNNALSGAIPSELGNLSQLKELWLFSNSLSGAIPSELGNLSQLQELWLYDNSLSGAIPSELGNLSQLQWLYLYNNKLSGVIPAELGNLSELQWLNLYNNSLSGAIPAELGNLAELKRLYLHNNSISGAIPAELGNLSELQRLYLGSNSVSGAIPAELGNLSELRWLDLHDNSLSGAIPSELGNLSQLFGLGLSFNSLSGAIPSELGNLLQLTGLGLSFNSLSGAIPAELGNLSELQRLRLAANSLSGAIPAELGNLSQLRYLDLSDNSLSGAIPSELGNLSELRSLNLSDNALTGVLPRSLLQLANLQELFFDGQDICAPNDTEFRRWLYSIQNATYRFCSGLHFADNVSDQSFPRAQPIAPLVLPEAIGGMSPVDYTLTPALPEALAFDAATRTISGTPTVVTPPASYTYKAVDANGSTDSLTFSIEVYASVSTERESLPEAFILHGNYPNPFRHSTRLVMDLPWPARVTVEVMDMVGRRVRMVPAVDMPAGWSRNIELSGAAMSSGLYLYRVHASSPEGSEVLTGRFVRIR